MMNIPEKKIKILNYLRDIGPSIPTRIGKAVGIEPFLSSTIMSELYGDKKVKMSNLRVGASPVYFLPGQEKLLENFTDSLNSTEKEAQMRLKEEKVLIDGDLTPATRIALRSIKDFAEPLETPKGIIWRYIFCTDEEFDFAFKRLMRIEEISPKEESKIKEVGATSIKEERIQSKEKTQINGSEEKVGQIPQKKIDTSKDEKAQKLQKDEKIEQATSKKSEYTVPEKQITLEPKEDKPKFFYEVKNFLKNRHIEFLEEITSDKKEVTGKIRINSDLGNITYLLIAKNKKTTSLEEITSCIQRAVYHKMPCFLALRRKPSKKIQKALEENSLIKTLVMP